ncbi:MAG: hypothetical protein JSW57_08920 [Flavobacteriaceae bacterium]|nr:MAG: hypothetical protein JSW57_08920 [Flavobacteriaceae bacterium]
MKKIKYLFVFIIGVLLFGGCDQEEEISYVFQDISAPTNVQAKFDISQDDTGEVSVTPTAEGATLFEIYFGDTENETPMELNPGETASHVYKEGEFNLRIIAIGLTGLTSELNRIVTISFAAPEDLEVNVTQSGRLEITVTPSATNATVYDIYFGDGADEEPITIMDGESAVYVYETAGEYTIRVVARGAGVATTEASVTFNVQDLTNAETFPIDFESNETLTGVFEEGDGVTGSVIANPDASGINTSETVFEFNKAEGAAWYSGIFHIFAEDMDLSEKQQFSIKIWSPKAGINVRFAIEKEQGDAGLNLGIDQTLEVAEEWVTLTYDFTGIVDPSNPYDKFVIFPDFDATNQPAGDGSIYYIDDIVLEAPAAEPPQLPIDFESATLDYTWNGFGSADFTEIPAGVIANPDASGINTSGNVTFITKTAGAQVWAGASLNLAGAIDFSLGTFIDVKVWSPRAGTPILLKIEDSTSPPDGNGNPTVFAEVQASTTVASTWETLSFDMTSFGDFNTANSYDRIILFPDFGTSGQDEDFYFDDIEISTGDGGGETSPTQAAPDPIQAQANVINMFSNVYTQDVAVSSWRSDWSTSTLTDIQINGNDTKEYIDADFVGVEFYGSAVDATAMDFFHVDVWTPNATTFRVKLVDLGGASATEGEIAFEGIAQGEWVSLDIPMEDFVNAGMSAVNSIQQLIFSGLPTGTFDFYVDNVYFYKVPPTSPQTAAPDPTEAQVDVINMYSDVFTQDVAVSSWRSDWSTSTLTDIQVDGNNTKEYIDADFVGVEFYGDPVDATNMAFFHVDIWTPNATTFRVKLVDLGGATGTEAEIAFEGIAQGEWVSLDIPMSQFVDGGMTAISSIQQLIFSGLPTGTFDFYIDNVYFHN